MSEFGKQTNPNIARTRCAYFHLPRLNPFTRLAQPSPRPSTPTHKCRGPYREKAGGPIIRTQRSGMESHHLVFYHFVFSRKPAQYKENGRRQHMASDYQCVSYSYEFVMLRTPQTSRWNSGLKCRQPLRRDGRIKLRIRMSLDSIWEALAAPSIWDSCPRFLEPMWP